MFLILKFWSWIFEKSAKIWAASYKNESNLLLVGITVCLESFLPIGCRPLICWKNPPKWCQFWFRLQIVGFLHSQAVISRTIGDFPALLEHGSAENIAVCAHNPWSQQGGWLEAFLYEAAQNFEVFFKYSRSKLKNQKPIVAVDVFFQAYPMVPLSGWSNLAGRYL
jgi:hypothetical protein